MRQSFGALVPPQLFGVGCSPLWCQRSGWQWQSHSQVVRFAKKFSIALVWCAQRQKFWCVLPSLQPAVSSRARFASIQSLVRTLVARIKLPVLR